MWEKNHNNSHTECRIDIGIDRSEIVMKSWEECENPIEEETVEICAKDIDENTANKPETLIEREIVSEKWLKESLHMLHDEKTCCMYKPRLALAS